MDSRKRKRLQRLQKADPERYRAYLVRRQENADYEQFVASLPPDARTEYLALSPKSRGRCWKLLCSRKIAQKMGRLPSGERERVFLVPSATRPGEKHVVRTHGSEDPSRFSCDCQHKQLEGGEIVPRRHRQPCCHRTAVRLTLLGAVPDVALEVRFDDTQRGSDMVQGGLL